MSSLHQISSASTGVSPEEIAAHFSLLPERYFMQTDEEDVARHIGMVNRLLHTISTAESMGSLRPVVEWVDVPARGHTVVHVATWDRAGLFHKLAGALSVAGLSIHSARIITRSDHIALDSFEVTGPDGGPVKEERLQTLFFQTIESALMGKLDLAGAIATHSRRLDFAPFREHPPHVEVYLEVSSPRIIVEVQTIDRFGLLYALGRVIAAEGYGLSSARICTERCLALDTFYLDAADPESVETPRLLQLRDALLAVSTLK